MGGSVRYGDPRKCSFCYLPVPDHHPWCRVGQAIYKEVAALRRKIMKRRSAIKGDET